MAPLTAAVVNMSLRALIVRRGTCQVRKEGRTQRFSVALRVSISCQIDGLTPQFNFPLGQSRFHTEVLESPRKLAGMILFECALTHTPWAVSGVTDGGLVAIAKSHPGLKTLSADGCSKVTNATLEVLICFDLFDFLLLFQDDDA